MKRSEMIQKLNDRITRIEAKSFSEGITSAGQWLLNLIESNGMLPPCKSVFIEYYDKQGINGIQTMLDNFKWELEDEKK